MEMTRYLVIRVVIDCDKENVDKEELIDMLSSELDYNADFDGEIEMDGGETVKVKIVDTMIEAMLDSCPV